ncbi:MAG: class I adenylate-forming enzyme family protein [Pseudomonadota bacterium]
MTDAGPLALDGGAPPSPPARFNMAAHVLAAAAVTPDKTALDVLPDASGAVAARLTYGALDRRVRALAAALRQAGLRPGDRVGLRLASDTSFPILFFATIAAGGVACPIAAALTEGEAAALVARLRPRFLAWSEGLALAVPAGTTALPPGLLAEMAAEAPGPVADTAADDPAFLIFTSGTSGRPRGVLHAQRSAWARRMMWDGWYGLEATDRMLHAGAFNWTFTLGTGLTDPWAAGATALIYAGPRDPLAWPRLAAAHGATIFAAVPGVYRQLLRSGDDLRGAFATLRHGLTAGERLSPAVAEAWRARTGKGLHEALGMSEVSTFVSGCPARPAPPGTAGYAQPGRRIAVLDEAADRAAARGIAGRLAVDRRDPGLMLGYWEEPGADAAHRVTTPEGRWFVTGDRAVMAADGAITHLGRGDDVMNALGYRVAPQEVEEALSGLPGVAEIAVAELPVREDLSLIAAFVVPGGDAGDGEDAGDGDGTCPDEATLAALAEARLAPYKRPKLWIAVDSLPRTPNGKLQRRALVDRHRRDR